MKTVRIAVIGSGFMGSFHARVLSNMPLVELVGVVDVDPLRAQRLSEELDVLVYDSVESLLAETDVDAIDVCTSDENHRDPVLLALERGKDVLVEKPLSTRIEEALEIKRAAEGSSQIVMVAHLLRFDPRYAIAYEQVASGTIGDIDHITCKRNSPISLGPQRYSKDKSLAFHVAIHDLDLLLWFSGDHPKRVHAESTNRMLANRGMNDSILAIITFHSGIMASLEASWILPEQTPAPIGAEFHIYGTKGSISISTADQGLLQVDCGGVHYLDTMHRPAFHGAVVGDLYWELLHFVDCVRRRRQPLVGVDDAIKAIELADALERACKANDASVHDLQSHGDEGT